MMTFAAVLSLLLAAEEPDEELEDTAPPAQVVSVNVLGLAVGALGVEYERALTPHVSGFLTPTYFYLPSGEGRGLGVTGPGLTLGAKLYPFGAAPAGVFIAPELMLNYLHLRLSQRAALFGVAAGGTAGYSFIIGDWLVLSFGLGATAFLRGHSFQGFTTTPGSVYPLARTNVGFPF